VNILQKFKSIAPYLIRLIFKLIGKDWNSFYAWLLNKIERKNSFDSIKNINRLHGFYSLKGGEHLKHVLIKNGLKKYHRVLDFGCGYGRVGVPLIKYLKKSSYTGIDLSKERIRLAKEYVLQKNLLKKNPEFYVSHSKSLNELLGSKKYDVIVIYTVIVHNPLKNVEIILHDVKKYLKPKGLIFFDYSEPTNEDLFTKFLGFKIKLSVKDYRHTFEEIQNIIKKLKLTSQNIPHKNIKGHKWQLNKSFEKNRRFIKLSKL